MSITDPRLRTPREDRISGLEVSPEATLEQLRRRARLLDPEERRQRWQERRCAPEILDRGVDGLFFSLRGERRALEDYCGPCPARVQCALRALEEDARSDYLPEGTVGGLTAADRLRILLVTPSANLERSAV